MTSYHQKNIFIHIGYWSAVVLSVIATILTLVLLAVLGDGKGGGIFVASALALAIVPFLFVNILGKDRNTKHASPPHPSLWTKIVLGIGAITYILLLFELGQDDGHGGTGESHEFYP